MWKYCDSLARMGPSSSYLRIFILIICFWQVAPCPTEVSQNDIDCMSCNNQCPKDFYHDTSTQQCSTTTAATTTVTTESTQTTSTLAPSSPVNNETGSLPADGVSDTTTGATQVQSNQTTVNETLLICRRCNKQNPSANCVTNETAVNNGAIIAGCTVAGVVFVTIVVALVVLWCWRRKRSKSASGMMDEQPQMSGGLRHDSSADLVTKRDKPQGDPTYQNFQHTRPTISSIEQGHDKVLRYTRDPTLKRDLLNRSNMEDKELEELGQAPLPPGSQEVYEDSESRSDQSFSRRGHQPLPPVPGEHRAPVNSQRNRPVTGQGKRGVHAETTKKHAKLEEDDPDEDYQNIEKPATGKNAPSTVKGKLPPAPTAHTGGDVDKEDEDSSPDESYENVGAKKKLTKTKRKEGNSRSGQVNPAAAANDDDEPEEMYGNQDAVEEQRRQSRPHKPVRNNTTTTTTTTTTGGTDTYIAMNLRRAPRVEDDEVQPVYGNDANENPYVNLPFDTKGGYS